MNISAKRGGNKIDWGVIRAGLKKAEAATAEALEPTAERARIILQTRARDLAQVPTAARASNAYLDLIVFGLAKERYAIETRFVHEVNRLLHFTPVPGTPAFVIGVTNIRGLITAIIDIRPFFNVQAQGLTDLSRIIVLGRERAEFAILADEIHSQTDLATDQLFGPPGGVSARGGAYLRGITKTALVVLDGAALLDDPQLTIENR
jgi:purine-binding chemotaxis protein CheW